MRRWAVGVLLILLAAPAAARAAAWEDYVLAPPTQYLRPVRVFGIHGDVKKAGALVTGGITQLTYKRGDDPPILVIDYGKEVGGFPTFDVKDVKGHPVIRSTYAEKVHAVEPDGDYAGKQRLTRVQEADAKPGVLRSAQLEGGERYEAITLSTPGRVRLSGAGMFFSGVRATAASLRGNFLSSDDLLNRIWYAGVYTLNLNQIVPGLKQRPGQFAANPVIIDGAKRDRKVWAGDLITADPTVFYALDPRYVKGSLSLLAANAIDMSDPSDPSSAGLLQFPGKCLPDTQGQTGCAAYSAVYSMAFILALSDYYRYTGDHAFVEQMWPLVERELAWNARHIDPDGLMAVAKGTGKSWNLEPFVGELTMVNSVYYEALQDAAVLSDSLGAHLGDTLRARASDIKNAVNAQLWNDGLGIYDVSTTQRGPVAQDANVFAVTSGLAPSDRAARALDTLDRTNTTPYGTMNVNQPFPDNFRPIISPFMGGIQLDAEFQSGRDAAALGLIRSEWGYMVDHGPGNTDWEKIQVSGALSRYTSAAHSWSTRATSALSEFVLGAAPATPGYKTWSVCPHPGDVQWVQGAVPTRFGPLTVRWNQSAGFAITVQAPAKTKGVVCIPLNGQSRTILRDGKPVKPNGMAGDYAFYTKQSGTHKYAWGL